jgi:thiamine biosynthesis lipoprotein
MRAACPGLAGGLVDLGGDIAVCGESPEGGPWLVAVADPRRPGSTLAVLALEDGGVATSGRDARRFGPAGSLHHLIDPETGESALAGPLTVTVVAPDAATAEGHATTLAIAGLGEAAAHVAERPAIAALYVPHTGPAIPLGDLPLALQRLVVSAA